MHFKKSTTKKKKLFLFLWWHLNDEYIQKVQNNHIFIANVWISASKEPNNVFAQSVLYLYVDVNFLGIMLLFLPQNDFLGEFIHSTNVTWHSINLSFFQGFFEEVLQGELTIHVNMEGTVKWTCGWEENVKLVDWKDVEKLEWNRNVCEDYSKWYVVMFISKKTSVGES